MSYVIYRCDRTPGSISHRNAELSLCIWRPSLSQIVPPGLPRKYALYWLFHFLRIFSNAHYAAVLGYKGEDLACSCLVVPRLYKWPFMKRRDVQLIYVKTKADFRGRGYAHAMIDFALQSLPDSVETVWYATDHDNTASIALAKATGFVFFSKGYRKFLFGLRFLKTLQITRA